MKTALKKSGLSKIELQKAKLSIPYAKIIEYSNGKCLVEDGIIHWMLRGDLVSPRGIDTRKIRMDDVFKRYARLIKNRERLDARSNVYTEDSFRMSIFHTAYYNFKKGIDTAKEIMASYEARIGMDDKELGEMLKKEF